MEVGGVFVVECVFYEVVVDVDEEVVVGEEGEVGLNVGGDESSFCIFAVAVVFEYVVDDFACFVCVEVVGIQGFVFEAE